MARRIPSVIDASVAVPISQPTLSGIGANRNSSPIRLAEGDVSGMPRCIARAVGMAMLTPSMPA